MNKRDFKSLIKNISFGILESFILVLIGLAIVSFNNYNLKDVLFVEGIVLIILAVFCVIGGDSTGLSLQGMGQNNAQYLANANLEILKLENEKTKRNLRPMLNIGLNAVSMTIGGVICIIIDLII
ncbi:MAG TPA: hypothetical protein VF839_09500 [Clostridium sp.]